MKWPIARMVCYIRQGVDVKDLTPAQAERGVKALKKLHRKLRHAPKPDISTNDWGHTVFFWIGDATMTEFRVTPRNYQAMRDFGNSGGDIVTCDLAKVVGFVSSCPLVRA